jgi:hypothetical protein
MKVGMAIYQLIDNASATVKVSGRIYPEQAPDGAATPYIVYTVLSNQPYDDKGRTPIDEANVEIITVSSTYGACMKTADAVRDAIDRKSATVTDNNLGTINVQSIRYTNETTEISDDRKLYAAIQEYTIRITR